MQRGGGTEAYPGGTEPGRAETGICQPEQGTEVNNLFFFTEMTKISFTISLMLIDKSAKNIFIFLLLNHPFVQETSVQRGQLQPPAVPEQPV